MSMTIRDLLEKFRNKETTCTSIIEDAAKKSPQYAGHMLETLGRIMVAFRLLDKNALLWDGSSNDICLPIKNWPQFMERSIVSGSADGFSDITWSSGDVIYMTSAKYIKPGSSLEDYDIDKLSALDAKYPNNKHVVLVRNREEFNKTYESATGTKKVRRVDIVYDVTDLDNCVPQLWSILNYCDWDMLRVAKDYLTTTKTLLKLRFHQILCRLSLRRTNSRLSVLIDMKARGGKSYCLADHILENKMANVLVLTPIPNETKQMLIHLFNSLVNFDGYTITELKAGAKIPKNSKKNIFVASKQYFDKHVKDASLTNLKFDAVYFDEIHFGGLTPKAKLIFNTHCTPTTRLVTISGTSEKAKCIFGITSDQTFSWHMDQEQLCRDGDVQALVDRYGLENVNIALTHAYGTGKDYAAELRNDYARMPKLTHMGLTLSREVLKRIKLESSDGYSFDTAELFRVEKGKFVHPDKVTEFMNLHFGRSGGGGTCTMKRIKAYNTRTHNGTFVSTQLWFLPQGGEGGIDAVSTCMEEAIRNHNGYGKKYLVCKFNGIDSGSSKFSLEEKIAHEEKKARDGGYMGLIVLLGSMGNMGVSLPNADIVVMLNNIHEMDRYIQMIMRCMTESLGKSRGFVVDYNQKRFLRFCLSIVGNSGHTEVERILRRAIKIIDIDSEDFEAQDKTDLVNQLMNIWSNSDINRPDAICSRLEALSSDIVLSTENRNQLNSYMRKVSSNTTAPKLEAELFDEDDKISDASVTSESKPPTADKPEKDATLEIVPDYARELIRTIPFYLAVLTPSDSDTNFTSLLKKVSLNSRLNDAFCSQCKTWWGGAEMIGFIDCLIHIVETRCNLNTRTEINSSIKMLKTEMTRLLDNKKALLALINSMLSPKQFEKKKFGEVYTPLDLVEKMLDNIPENRWKDPSLTWFDPAAGIGNFMVCVYYRLMNGLVDAFPNEKDRQTHIIKNMLFMSEIGAKNVSVCKLIFGEDCNVYHGDTLALNTSTVWKKDSFDEVVGNPPYNDDSGNKGATHSLWVMFLEKAMGVWVKPGGHLTFVHPPLWRQYGNKLLNIMKQNQIVALEIHSLEDGNKVFKCSTAYDFYTLEKTPCYGPTRIVCEAGKTQNIDLRSWKFIPNTMFDTIAEMCVDGEKLDVHYYRSAYGHDKAWMSATKTATHIHPVIYTIAKDGTPTIHWSSRNDNGQFGISKFIFSNGAGFLQDPDGKYAVTQWSYYIAAPPAQLPIIENAFRSKKFQDIRNAIKVDSSAYNIPLMKNFAHKFWEML